LRLRECVCEEKETVVTWYAHAHTHTAFVDMAFGTGAVKITPAHDHNDYALGLKHNLLSINLLNDDGTINANGGKYEGMKVRGVRVRVRMCMCIENEGRWVTRTSTAYAIHTSAFSLSLSLSLFRRCKSRGGLTRVCDVAHTQRYDCRDMLLGDLKGMSLYRGQEANPGMRLGMCSRSKDVVEPLLKPQWYVNCDDLAKKVCVKLYL